MHPDTSAPDPLRDPLSNDIHEIPFLQSKGRCIPRAFSKPIGHRHLFPKF
jgi:hypothetical protein